MDALLEHGLRLHTQSEHKNLYKWAINEMDAQGQRIGHDQIPWEWTLHFTATSCVLRDNIDMRSQFQMEENTPAPRKIVQSQAIHVELRPGHPRGFRKTTFSMFGTSRDIKSFQLQIHPIADPAEQENCSAWGSVSYTTEIDFRNETTDDCIIFYLFVKPETFARYGAKRHVGAARVWRRRSAAVPILRRRNAFVPSFPRAWPPRLRSANFLLHEMRRGNYPQR